MVDRDIPFGFLKLLLPLLLNCVYSLLLTLQSQPLLFLFYDFLSGKHYLHRRQRCHFQNAANALQNHLQHICVCDCVPSVALEAFTSSLSSSHISEEEKEGTQVEGKVDSDFSIDARKAEVDCKQNRSDIKTHGPNFFFIELPGGCV